MHEPDIALEQAPREHTVSRKARFDAVGIVDAVEGLRLDCLIRKVGGSGRFELHAGGRLVARDAGGEFRIAGVAGEMAVVE